MQIQYVSIAFTCRGSASPRHLQEKLSRPRSCRARRRRRGPASVLPSASRAERATIDIICADSRPRSSRACSSEISLSFPSFHSPDSRAVSAWRSAGALPVSPRRLVRLRVRHLRLQVVVDEEAPDVLVRNLADERLDVDAAVAKRSTLAIGLHDLGLDGDDAFEPGSELGVSAHVDSSSSIARPIDRPFAAASTRAAAATSWTATPTDLYRVISSGEVRPGLVPATSSPSSA